MSRPGKIVCVGRNYVAHAKELGNEVPKQPLLFLKPPSSVVGPGEAIVVPPASAHVEFEGEIAVVSGRRPCGRPGRGRRARGGGAAPAAMGGSVALNDVPARDLQKSDGQWTRAKG